METVFAFRRVAHAILVHFCEQGTESSGVWDPLFHVDEFAEAEMAINIRGVSAKGYGGRESIGGEGM